MVQNYKRWIRLAVVLALVLAGVLVTAPSARAQGILYGSTIPAGATIENDAIMWGDTVTVDGTVDGDVFAFGRTIAINGSVTGSVITGGQTIDVEGKVGGSVYSVGQYLGLGPEATVGRTAYMVGMRVATQSGSTVGRDLSVLALGAQLNGSVGRESRAVVGVIEWIEIFTRSVDWQRGQLQVRATSSPQAVATQEPSGPARSVLAALGPMPAVHAAGNETASARAVQEGNGVDPIALQEWLLGRMRELIILLVVGALALWLLPAPMECWVERLRAKPLPSAGLGLVAYVTGYAGPVLLGLLIFASGLALAMATFWTPAFVVWGIGYSALGLAFFTFLLFALYGSKVIVSYLVGAMILGRWPRVARYRILPLLLGVVLYVLLRSIPILGWVLGFVVTFLGLGAVCLGGWKMCRGDKGQEVEVKVSAPETADVPVAMEAVETAEPAEPVEASE